MGTRAPDKTNFNVWMNPAEKKELRETAAMLGLDMGSTCKMAIHELRKILEAKKEGKQNDDKGND